MKIILKALEGEVSTLTENKTNLTTGSGELNPLNWNSLARV